MCKHSSKKEISEVEKEYYLLRDQSQIEMLKVKLLLIILYDNGE